MLLAMNGCGILGPRHDERPDTRIVVLGFEDIVREHQDWEAVNERLAQANANAVNITVGRPDWVAFPWPAQPDAQSSYVSASGKDYVQQAVDALSTAPDGTPRRLTLTIDTLVSGWIGDDERIAGRDIDGKVSPDFPSASALRDGAVGQRIEDIVTYVSQKYRPDEIGLTELMFDQHTFGDDDLELYARMTGHDDWPRRRDNEIDVTSPKIAAWRSQTVADVVARMRDVAHAGGAQMAVDVRAPWNAPTGDRAESGHDYRLLLSAADRIVVWNYYGLSHRTAAYSAEITKAMQEQDMPMQRITMAVGLWADEDGRSDAAGQEGTQQDPIEILPAEQLLAGLQASATHGVESVAVIPMSMMGDDHWRAVEEAWG